MRFWRLAWRNLFRKRQQTLQNAFGVAISVCTLVVVTSMVRGSLQQAVTLASQSDSGHVTITAAGYPEASKRQPLELALVGYAPTLGAIRALPGVTAAAPRLRFSALVANGSKSLSVRVLALETDSAALPVQLQNTITVGHGLGAPHALVLGRPMAKLLGLRQGQMTKLSALDADGQVRTAEFQVAGMVESGQLVYDERQVMVGLADAQAWLRMPGRATEIGVTGASADAAPALAADITRLLPGSWVARPWQATNQELLDRVKQGERLFGVVIIGLLLSSVASMMNTIVMSVAERTREIGTMRALGMHAREVGALFLMEGALLGVLGSGVGTVLGAATLWTLDDFLRTNPAMKGPVGPLFDLTFDGWLLVVFFGMGVAAAVIAYAGPARMAASLEPTEALRRG